MESHGTHVLSLPVLIMRVEMLILEAFFTNGIWARVGTASSSFGSQKTVRRGYFSIFASGHGECLVRHP